MCFKAERGQTIRLITANDCGFNPNLNKPFPVLPETVFIKITPD